MERSSGNIDFSIAGSINQIVVCVVAGAYVGVMTVFNIDGSVTVGPDCHTPIIVAQTVYGSFAADRQRAGTDIKDSVAACIGQIPDLFVVQIHSRFYIGFG